MVDIGQWPKRVRKPVRPRAISTELEPVVIELYRRGYGYRAIANTLRQDYHANPHFNSVRKTLIRLGTLGNGVHEYEDLS
ncbi:MAG: hypothetical protein HY530_06460 [Chloroflexi bacterium]|nr:hypothetical protein [Chloroflexota bacterium]